MYTGKLLVYHYNGLHNSEAGMDRDIYAIKHIQVQNKEEFRAFIEESLDEVPPGKGYALVKWDNRLFVCEKDINNPKTDYVKQEIKYHPLLDVLEN